MQRMQIALARLPVGKIFREKLLALCTWLTPVTFKRSPSCIKQKSNTHYGKTRTNKSIGFEGMQFYENTKEIVKWFTRGRELDVRMCLKRFGMKPRNLQHALWITSCDCL